jgi:hypothetical protein
VTPPWNPASATSRSLSSGARTDDLRASPSSPLTDQLASDIINGGGTSSWPMCYISFIQLKQNISTLDCTYTQELLTLLSWTQVPLSPRMHACMQAGRQAVCALPRRLLCVVDECNARRCAV